MVIDLYDYSHRYFFSHCPQRLRKLTSSLTDLSFLGGRRRGGSSGKMEEREKENQLPGLSTMENLQMLTLKEHYDVEKELGRGTYGKVNMHTFYQIKQISLH